MQLSGEETVRRVKEIAQELQALFGNNRTHVILSCSECGVKMTCFGPRTYAEAVEWFRWLGVGDREKTVHPTYTQLTGEIDGVQFATYPDELPPSCRVVTKTRRIPKVETKDTGEYIEVEEQVVECGEPAAKEATV